jgi:hypothetical protein
MTLIQERAETLRSISKTSREEFIGSGQSTPVEYSQYSAGVRPGGKTSSAKAKLFPPDQRQENPSFPVAICDKKVPPR